MHVLFFLFRQKNVMVTHGNFKFNNYYNVGISCIQV